MADLWQKSTNSGGWYHVAATYWPTGPTGLLNTLTAPGLSVFTYNPDGEGRVGSVQAGSAYLVSSTQYNDFRSGWLPMVVNLGSGDSDTFTFDTNTGRMNQYKAAIGTFLVKGDLTWNGNGSLAQLVINDTKNPANNQACAYTHDDLARISKVDCGSGKWGQNFTYDAFGNITKTAFSGPATSFNPGYNASTNQVACTGCFDANGNPTQDGPRPPGNSYAWDAEGNLSQFNGGTAMVYDALGRRVEQPGAQILYGPGGSKLALMNGQSVTKAFVPLPGGATAVYNGTTLAWYRHPDWLGSSRVASTPTAPTSVYYDGAAAYSPFGESPTETGNTDHNFTGQNQDLVANFLYDFPAREYNPGQSRWISPDPAGLAAVNPANPQSWNRYAYVNGSPLNSVDPLGLCDNDPLTSGPDCGSSYPAVPGSDYFNATQLSPPAPTNTVGYAAWSQGWDSWSTPPNTPGNGLSQQGGIFDADPSAFHEDFYATLMEKIFESARDPDKIYTVTPDEGHHTIYVVQWGAESDPAKVPPGGVMFNVDRSVTTYIHDPVSGGWVTAAASGTIPTGELTSWAGPLPFAPGPVYIAGSCPAGQHWQPDPNNLGAGWCRPNAP